jgi:TetR/AcrR family transcriptional regulator, regulator of biofilm formation and stress response
VPLRDGGAPPGEETITDGRRRKGALRRRALLEATARVVGTRGLAGLSQRSVAAEAGVPASAVLYYFESVDDLVGAAFRALNDGHIAGLTAAAGATDAPAALAAFFVQCAEREPWLTAAETELWLLAPRRDDLAMELARWERVLGDVTARLTTDPVAAHALTLVIDGLYVHIATGGSVDRDATAAVFRRLLPR